MAREVVIRDDLDGSLDAEPVQFTWDGVNWEIDLTDANRKKLADALTPFLEKAHPSQIAQPQTIRQRAPRGSRPDTEKIDYTEPSYAGNPHKGRVSPAEAEYVRTNLNLVNQRLKAEGLREIDRADTKMKDRYGL
jgi:hypothetical protein